MFIITALVAILVFISLGLVITVPVALATPGEWEESKLKFTKIFQIWMILIAVIATIDGVLRALS